MTSFPRLGVPGVFTEPYFDPADAVSSHSLFLPEEITNPHARFPLVPLPACVLDPLLNVLFTQHAYREHPPTSGVQGGNQSPHLH